MLSQFGEGKPATARVVKPAWFGRQVTVLLLSDKSVTGELTEVSEHYIVLNTKSGERQIMVHAIAAVWPAGEQNEA